MDNTENNHQKNWDAALIQAWHDEALMAHLVNAFFRRYAPEFSDNVEAEDLWAVFEYLGVNRRWYTNKTTEGHKTVYLRMSVRDFVGSRCPHLAACLLENTKEGNTDADILKAIPHFAWRRVNSNIRRKRRAAYIQRNGGAQELVFNIRERDKKTNWKTVK